MGLTCNIGRVGRILRLVYGIVLLGVGAWVLYSQAWPGENPWWWVLGIFLLLGGAFAIFEARRGWCAMRAMGWQTPW
jgi:uncharacterized membrane protein HdeD (DUF308 family)